MVVCVYLPRFELVVAAGSSEKLTGRALAVAPLVGSEQRLGEVSGAAEAYGVARGMQLGEALARCPDLVLLPPDPVRVADAWERELRALESIGAAVEPARPGLAYFEAGGLHGIHGTQDGTIAAARRVLARTPRMGAGPTRFCALAAAMATRSGRPLTLEGSEARRWLVGQPVTLLGFRAQTAPLLGPLERLGVRTLGELSKLGRAALTDRFGETGALAHQLASGEDSQLRVRRLEERLEESMEVSEASSGESLGCVLSVLVRRMLARPERRGRTLRAVTLSAHLVSGGGWRERVVFRQALLDPERIWLALSVRLPELPAPAAVLRLSVERFGPPANEQSALFGHRSASRGARQARLREAVAQTRAMAGMDAALRAVCVDPDSRVPERRVVLAPVPD